jgi:hypothetical protein
MSNNTYAHPEVLAESGNLIEAPIEREVSGTPALVEMQRS